MPPEKLRSYFVRHYLRGAEGCSMWHFRRHPGGQEMFLGACLEHSGRPSWAFEGLKDVGRLVKTHGPALLANRRKIDVAILHSYDDLLLATMHARQLGLDEWSILDGMIPLLEALERRGLGVAFARATDDLSGYAAVFAPQTFMLTREIADALTAYVRGGGKLVASNRLGLFDEYGKAQTVDLPAMLTELFGLSYGRVEEAMESEPVEGAFSGDWGSESLTCLRAMELCPTTARPVATFRSHRIAGSVAAAVNEYGAGKAIFVGIEQPSVETLAALTEKILRELDVPFQPATPENLEVIRGDTLTGYINISESDSVRVDLPAEKIDLLTGETVQSVTLPPYGCLIVEN